MSYNYREKKTVIVVASELDAGKVANIVGHLAIALGHRLSEHDMGKHPLVDGSGISHAGISKYPVIVTCVKSSRLRRLLSEVRNIPDLLVVDYPEQMLNTGHDEELVAALSTANEESLRYLGVALHGLHAPLTELTGKFSLWKPEIIIASGAPRSI